MAKSLKVWLNELYPQISEEYKKMKKEERKAYRQKWWKQQQEYRKLGKQVSKDPQ